jgi:transposase-like protein
MSQRAATIESLPEAFALVKAMHAEGLEWDAGYRPLARRALAEIIELRLAEAVDRWLDGIAEEVADRRNGSYRRHLLSELGDIELSVPRTRRYCPSEVLRAYARRAPEIDRVILAGFVLGLSTRKVGEALLALLGRPVSAATVSTVAKSLDTAVAAFHARPLANRYHASCSTAWCSAARPAPGR